MSKYNMAPLCPLLHVNSTFYSTKSAWNRQLNDQ